MKSKKTSGKLTAKELVDTLKETIKEMEAALEEINSPPELRQLLMESSSINQSLSELCQAGGKYKRSIGMKINNLQNRQTNVPTTSRANRIAVLEANIERLARLIESQQSVKDGGDLTENAQKEED